MSSENIVIFMNGKRVDWPFVQFMNSVYDEGAASVRAELEAVRAELAAERVKLRGGVAWAVKNKKTGKLDGSALNDGHPLLHESRGSAEKYVADDGCRWEVVPYPLGDGADELKAAIERAEKAEAEVAAWKEAANSNKINGELVPNVGTPVCLKARIEHLADWVNGLSRRIDTGNAELEAAVAALKAAHAEVPPLHPWRVLATARRIAIRNTADPQVETERFAFWSALDWALVSALRIKSCGGVDPYQVAE